MKLPDHNRWTTKGSGYSLSRAAKIVGLSEGLLVLWVSTGRFTPSIELTEPGSKELMGWGRFTVTDKDLKQLRKMVEDSAKAVAEEHVKGSDYSVQELALRWNLSEDKTRELCANEAGVKKIPSKNKRSSYITLRIPESVAARIERKLS